MKTNEQIKKFDELYEKMSESTDVKDMELFGKVMREAMTFMAERFPEKSEELLEELCAINWDNYLTKKEAETIVAHMQPAPAWTKEQMKRELSSMGLEMEEKPFYNECALYATISMIASDSMHTLSKYVPNNVLEVCYSLAVDKLKDEDKVFNIRKYFDV